MTAGSPVAAGSVGSAATSTAPGAAQRWRAARGPVAVGLTLLLIAVVVALVQGRRPAGALDPDATDPAGSRALAQLLRDRGVGVQRVDSVAALAAAGRDTTVFLPLPDRLPASAYADLVGAGRDLVVIDPDDDVLQLLAADVRREGSTRPGLRQPACALPAAVAAGVADTGGTTYQPVRGATNTIGCYAAAGAASLVTLPRATGGTTAVVGSPVAFTNGRLDQQGNAALALGLLAGQPRVQWLVPAPGAAIAAGAHDKSLVELLPGWVVPATLQLGIAVVAVSAWRARPLGPVVTEPLPVVVRAAETVEGRARLYRGAGARDRAAEALRAGARFRLIARLGLPPDAPATAVVEATAARVGRPAGPVHDLLYGQTPDNDTALVRLADDLDILDREVRRP